MARLVECGRPRRARTGGGHTWRAVRAHDRDLLRPRAARAHRRQGHAVSAATRPECAGVQRRDRVPFAAAGGAARDLWRPRTGRTLARLSRDVPAALAHRTGASGVNRANSLEMNWRSASCYSDRYHLKCDRMFIPWRIRYTREKSMCN